MPPAKEYDFPRPPAIRTESEGHRVTGGLGESVLSLGCPKLQHLTKVSFVFAVKGRRDDVNI
jgi:hypothetical protein